LSFKYKFTAENGGGREFFMKKIIRQISMITVIAVLAASLAGCNIFAGKKTQTANSDTLLWYLPGDKQNDMASVMEEVNKIVQPAIGVKLDIQFLDPGSYQDKMTMMMSSKKEFDLCFTSDWLNKFLPNVRNGGFMELDELINKNAPKLKTELPDYLYNASTVDGKIYAIPNLQVLFYQTCLFSFKDLVDKYNFDIKSVKKVEDIEPFLEIIKKNEPNLYPYRLGYNTAVKTNPVYESIEPATGVAIRKDGSSMKPVILAQTEENKSATRLFRSWYQKGYIRADINSVIDDNADVSAGKYAVTQAVWKPGGEAEGAIKNGGREVVFAPLEDPYLKANAGMSTMTAISKTSKNPEKAIKLLELVNTDKKLYNLICFGLENKHYTKIGQDRIDVIKDSGYTPNAAWKFGNQFNAYFMKIQAEDVWKETDRINNEAKRSPIAGFIFDTSEVTSELSQMATISKEFTAASNGSEDPDKLYDQYMSKLDEAGQQKVLQAVESQLNKFLKK